MSHPPEVSATAAKLRDGIDPWAPNGPQSPTDWDLCAASWRAIAQDALDELGRLHANAESAGPLCPHGCLPGEPCKVVPCPALAHLRGVAP